MRSATVWSNLSNVHAARRLESIIADGSGLLLQQLLQLILRGALILLRNAVQYLEPHIWGHHWHSTRQIISSRRGALDIIKIQVSFSRYVHHESDFIITKKMYLNTIIKKNISITIALEVNQVVTNTLEKRKW